MVQSETIWMLKTRVAFSILGSREQAQIFEAVKPVFVVVGVLTAACELWHGRCKG